MKKLPIVLLTASLLSSSACYAQLGEAPMPKAKLNSAADVSGPSLEETTQWIKQKYESPSENRHEYHGYWDNPNVYIKNEVSFHDCEMTVIQRMTKDDKFKENTGILEASIIPLDMANEKSAFAQANDTALSYLGTLLHSIGGNKVFGYKYAPRFSSSDQGYLAEVRQSKTDSVALPKLSSLELAERMTMALKHAIALCRIKAEKEAALNPKAQKPKEIF